ncbi:MULTISPECIES: iron-containing alcohol dehydrogenase family protein [Bacillus]|uniref:Glycerol dehydrogenase n=2 Tax=Bacillus TaxID=1386 RepID=A0A0M4GBD5_9BACI|nr:MULTISPECIES: iron-containing alcohol dehydrogenase family protein [Bacillus]ALC83015.1 glycerol dehydrogenase [Bacillus gobiensis]MED1096668.1 iron-containing alcohol dehydrogenase family protein [Bacillus capparidis]
MSFHLVSRVGPQQYISEEGAYNYLPEFLKVLSAARVLILHGVKSWHKTAPYLPDLNGAGFDVHEMTFGGECSYQEIDRVIQKIRESDIDLVIGLGGGKVIDTAKAAAFKSGGRPLVILPTMASNCAAWSALSVIYKDNGVSIGHEIYPKQSSLVLIEPRVILDSPIDYFIAGIADTLAKWYESDSLLTHVHQNHLSILYARESAKLCRDIPLKYAIQAVEDMKRGVLSEPWQLVMETNIIAGGLVGGFGDEYGRATAAHSIHDALTVFPETKHILHGVKVAYGIMVQLALEEKWEEVRRLQPFYQCLKLPMNLRDLHLDARPEEDIRKLAAYSVSPDKTIHLLPFEVTETSVFEAIQRLEKSIYI